MNERYVTETFTEQQIQDYCKSWRLDRKETVRRLARLIIEE